MKLETTVLAKESIINDEGVKNEVYTCTENYKTVGIGHKCLKGEPEYNLKVGSKISHVRVQELFNEDFDRTVEDCIDLFGDNWADYAPDIQIVLTNMCFQLGKKGLSKFKKMRAALEAKNYKEMAAQMKQSKWYGQTTNRADRLIAIVSGLDDG